MKRLKVRDRWQIALYVPRELEKPLRSAARRQNRAYSATVVEILREYFEKKDAPIPTAQATQ